MVGYLAKSPHSPSRLYEPWFDNLKAKTVAKLTVWWHKDQQKTSLSQDKGGPTGGTQ